MSVYKTIDLIGTSTTSWEDAAAGAIKTASSTVRDLRIAEVLERGLGQRLRSRLGPLLGHLGLSLDLLGGLGTRGADRAAPLFLDQNGFRAPMAEALAHMAGLHRPAHIERHLARAVGGLFFGLGLTHSVSVPGPFSLANAAARPPR